MWLCCMGCVCGMEKCTCSVVWRYVLVSEGVYLVWRCACVYGVKYACVWWYEGVYMCGGMCL